MKKLLVLMMILGLVLGSIATAEAGKKKKKAAPPAPTRIEKVVEHKYSGGNLGVTAAGVGGGGCFNDPSMPFACIKIVPPGSEYTYVKLEVTDASGQKAGGFISQQDADGDGLSDGYGNFCGSHPEPVALEVPGGELGVSLYLGTCADGTTPSIVTSGTIKLTFSNMP